MLKELPWIAEAKKHLGLREIVGAKHNPVILKWLADMGGFPKANKAFWKDDETPWCGLFVGHCLGVAGRVVIPDWYRAKAWADSRYLTKLDKPAYGCIAVKSRKGGGHVFFVVGKDKQGRLLGLGGNQGNAVSIVPFNPADIDSYWWSSIMQKDGVPLRSLPAPERYNLPLVSATGKIGASEA